MSLYLRDREEDVTKLQISNRLTNLSPSLFLPHAATLTTLNLSSNPSLCSLPDSISQLLHLKIAFFSNCSFATFPTELSECPSLEMVAFKSNRMTHIPEDAFPSRLRWLILTDNLISELPRSIGKASRLQKCMLAGNKLCTLPEEMAQCKKLGLLRIAANQIDVLPQWLFGLPELAFLAVAGNPCIPEAENAGEVDEIAAEEMDVVPWNALDLGEVLGQGASGVISKALWHKAESEDVDVAVKLFKSTSITSDGTPASELAACLVAGQHPHLISTLGRIDGHPSGTPGLVLKLVPPTYKILGLSPSMDSCTRDVFTAEAAAEMTITRSLKIVRGIAEAAKYLHERGIYHGDLYAHNILVDATGNALLSDFGAATVYTTLPQETWQHFQSLEVLAFGHLVDDVLQLADDRGSSIAPAFSGNDPALSTLRKLHANCVDATPERRPSFGEIVQILHSTEAID